MAIVDAAVGPRIVPLNYAVVDDAIVFRTTPYSEIASYGPGREAAFEIDNVDHSRQTGWSVVAFGRVERVDPSELDDLAAGVGAASLGGRHPQPLPPADLAGGHRPQDRCGESADRHPGAGAPRTVTPRAEAA